MLKNFLAFLKFNFISKSTYSKIFRREDKLPVSGFTPTLIGPSQLEHLSDDDFSRINEILPWKCFTSDGHGRRFGNLAWKGKRDNLQSIPDPRIVELDRLFNLSDKSVLELGCFEGVHTLGIALKAESIFAVDSRIENVIKTIVRANLYGFKPSVSVCDLEKNEDVKRLPTVDIIHHVGVLYHLTDPISHLIQIGKLAQYGFLLDTHYATDEMATHQFDEPHSSYKYYIHREHGRDEVFSGMYDHAKWLKLNDIKEILSQIGFSDIVVYKDDKKQFAPRVTIYAARPGMMRNL